MVAYRIETVIKGWPHEINRGERGPCREAHLEW